MKRTFSPQERCAFAKAVSAVEGIFYSRDDDNYFDDLMQKDQASEILVQNALLRALAKP